MMVQPIMNLNITAICHPIMPSSQVLLVLYEEPSSPLLTVIFPLAHPGYSPLRYSRFRNEWKCVHIFGIMPLCKFVLSRPSGFPFPSGVHWHHPTL